MSGENSSRAMPAKAAALMLGLALSIAAMAPPARADVIFDLDAQSTTGTLQGNGGAPTVPLDLVLTLTNAVVDSGSFSAWRKCSPGQPPCIGIGDFSVISLATVAPVPDKVILSPTPDLASDHASVSLGFDGSGAIATGDLVENTSVWTLHLTITGNTWSAAFNSDVPGYSHDCYGGPCQARGLVSVDDPQDVPEPPSLAMLGGGLFGLGLALRGRRYVLRSAVSAADRRPA
jgi:hypothetical protein